MECGKLPNAVKSISFCCISTGVFRFPNQRTAEIAVETVRNWLDEITILFVEMMGRVCKKISLKR